MVAIEHNWVKTGKREVCIATARDESGVVHRLEMWGDPPCREGLKQEIGKIAERAAKRFAQLK